MTINMQDWLKSVQDQVILNGQCWGLAQDYVTKVLGGGNLVTDGGAHPGYAIDSFDGYSNNGLSSQFSKLPASVTARAGDLAFWGWGTNYSSIQAPLGHVAVVLHDNGTTLDVMDQNSMGSNVSTYHTLPKLGLAGYLQPNNGGLGLDVSTDDRPLAAGSSDPNLPSTGIPMLDGLLNTLVKAGGNKNSPLSILASVQKGMTTFFLPATWVRVLALFIGIGLIVGGFVFIVKDYKNTGGE